ncbi:MAG: hypothetical protein HKN82_09040 [Akkermansiaceae bacterium]|nr:hypothetical protein [Akkermansiaceae bacterium]NNM31197.1 hypothetical protein [Akkermansiaceae bacterium]
MRFPHLPCAVLWFATTALIFAEAPAEGDTDLLRFTNGDSLHGRFNGMEDASVVEWSRSNIRNPLILGTAKLRRIALNGGRGIKSLDTPSFVALTNGDRIPGRVTAVDGETVTLETSFAGTLALPRKHVTTIAPNPHGGAVHYIGPFSEEGWELLESGDADPDPGEEPAEEDDLKKADADDAEPARPWVFSGGAWYSNAQVPIAIDAHLPDKARIRFRMAWRNRLSAVIAFHATLETPDPPEPEEGAKAPAQLRERQGNGFAQTYGESYVLNVYSSYAMLYRCSFDKEGAPQMDRLSANSANVRLSEVGEADFELRCDRTSNNISLYIDGRFVSQWEDPNGYSGTGTHLAFASQNSPGRLRISDVVASSWNGMLDSARSMESTERDVVLLTNGTDRFSGEIAGLENDKFLLNGTFAEMRLPVAEIEEIRFARKSRVKLPEASGQAIRILLQPAGRLTVEPVKSTRASMSARSAAFGDFALDLGYASLLEFSFSDSILDDWDEDF